MVKLKLFIADVDADHVRNLCACVSRCASLEIIGTESDGAKALPRIERLLPDVLLTDIQLPGLDGITLLRELQKLKRPPVSIVCTRFYSDTCVDYVHRRGAFFVLYKPVDYSRMPRIIEICHRQALLHWAVTPPHRPAARVAGVPDLLSELGFPARLTGSLYLREAANWLTDDHALLRNLSKGLYAEIAAATQSTPQRVERLLRSAIDAAYRQGALQRHFSNCPTNKEFLRFFLERLEG